MIGKPFQKGMAKTGGRAKDARTRLSHAFLTALAEDFEQFGAEVIRITRVERPGDYMKVVAGLMPREIDLYDNTLADLSDTELEEFIQYARNRIAERAREIGSREGPTSIN